VATPTYTLIEEQVLSSAQASVTLGSGGTIPQTYKDLILEMLVPGTSADDYGLIQVNSDTGSNYSYTVVQGDGSTATSSRASTQTSGAFGRLYNNPNYAVMNFQSYANTNVNKTWITRSNNSSYSTIASVSLWRSTSAVSSIKLFTVYSNTFNSGSTFRLWGVA